jgi:hypothetical protein
VDPRAGLKHLEKRKFLTLLGLELRPLGRPAHSQSLYRFCYVGSPYIDTLFLEKATFILSYTVLSSGYFVAARHVTNQNVLLVQSVAEYCANGVRTPFCENTNNQLEKAIGERIVILGRNTKMHVVPRKLKEATVILNCFFRCELGILATIQTNVTNNFVVSLRSY